MTRIGLSSLGFLTLFALSPAAHAVRSAELYSSASYGYGRMEARLRFAAGDGVVGSFFSWKEGSEVSGTFWNELDFEKLNANCLLATNPLYGNPAGNHSVKHNDLTADLCGEYHTYIYEWTPEAIVWYVDGVEIRRETGETAAAFAQYESAGMQVHFNLWPGDATFGGNFDPAILPVHQYIDWVQFSSYENGTFTLQWREDFDGGTVPAGWLTGSWASPKNLSTHDPGNVNFIDGYAVLSLTADNAVGPAGAMPGETGGSGGAGAGGSTSAGGAGAGGSAGSSSGAGSGGSPDSAGGTGSGGSPPASGGSTGVGGSSPAAGAPSGGGANPNPQGEATTSSNSGSCSVGVASGGHRGAWLSLLGIAASLLLRKRKRSS